MFDWLDWFKKSKSIIATIAVIGIGIVALWTATFAAIMLVEELNVTDTVKVLLCIGIAVIQFLFIRHISKTVKMTRRQFGPKVERLDNQWLNARLQKYDRIVREIKKLDEKIAQENLKIAALKEERDRLREQLKVSDKK